MNRTKTECRIDDVAAYILLIMAVVLYAISLPHAIPSYADPQVFQYVGRSVASGHLHYTEVWDHKGPFIHLYYALGNLLSAEWTLGVQGIKVLTAFFSLIMLYFTIVRVTGAKLTSAFLALGGMAFAFYVNWAITWDMPEHLHVTFSVVGLYFLLGHLLEGTGKVLPNIVVGAMVAMSALTKANLVGFGVFVVAVYATDAVLKRDFRTFLVRGCACAVGFAAVLTFLFVVYAMKGALEDMVDAMFQFNMNEYMVKDAGTRGIADLLLFEYRALGRIPGSCAPLFLVMVFSLGRACSSGVSGSKTEIRKIILPSALIWLAFEMFALGVNGFAFEHYYISATVPVLLCISACFSDQRDGRRQAGIALCVFSIFLLWMMLLLVSQQYKLSRNMTNGNADDPGVCAYIAAMEACNPEHQPIACYGGISVCEAMNHANVFTSQKYCIALYAYSFTNSQERRNEVERDLKKALRDCRVFIIADTPIDELPFTDDESRALFAGFKYVGKFKLHSGSILMYVAAEQEGDVTGKNIDSN